MKRLAIIAGTPLIPGQGPLPGVLVDKRRVRDFLVSDGGGAWEPHEIEEYEHFYLRPVDRNAPATHDFVLFYFAGHGFARNGDTYMCAAYNCDYSVDQLWLPARRQLVIVDACRTEEPDPGMVKGAAFGEAIGEVADPWHRQRCRALYDAAVMAADVGRTILYSCSPGESAGEDARRGGHFTRRLIEQSSRWAENRLPGNNLCLSASDALGLAAAQLDPLLQRPVAEPGRRRRDFPFAVAP